MRTLYFEGAGCEDTYRGEVSNCRIRTAFTNNEEKKIYLEISGYEKSDNDKKIKRYEDYQVGDAIGFIDFCFYITDDPEIDDCNNSRLSCERKVSFSYSYDGILKFVNEYCNCSFDEVIILPWLSGYNVHTGSYKHTSEDYRMMETFINIPERTAERKRIYNEVATKYFDEIYKNHTEANTKAVRLYQPMRNAHSIVSMDDSTMTIRSHTYAELIDDTERVKVFEVAF